MFSRPVRAVVILISLLLGALGAGAADNVTNSRGFDPEKVFQLGSVDHVNVMTGNVMLTIPLGQRYTVSPALEYGFTLAYNSKVWEIFPNSPARGQANDRANAGLGWTMNLGRLWDQNDSESPSPGWFWDSPDGGDHRFWLTEEDHVYVTRDGSYLRLRKNNLNMEIDFPNGVTHVYELIGDTEKWRLKKIHDRFKLSNGSFANWVEFEYDYTGTRQSKCAAPPAQAKSEVWFIADSHGRKHQVCLAERTFDGKQLMQVDEVHLDVFTPANASQQTAKYDLKYGPYINGDLVQLPCLGVLFEDQTTIHVSTLHELALPDGSSYQFEYHKGTTGMPAHPCDQGAISKMTLPTGGTTEWDYEAFFMPAGQACGFESAWGSHNVAVNSKTVKDAAGTEIGTWHYTYDFWPLSTTEFDCADADPTGPPPPKGVTPPEELKVTIRTPGGDKTEHYFSVWPGKDPRDPAPESSFIPHDHGLPFTRRVSDGGRFLSSEVFDCEGGTCTSLRKTYVEYEQDGTPTGTEWSETRRRLKAERTYTGTRYRDVENSDFDGYGHFRKTVVTSNDGDPARTTFTNFLPGSNAAGRDAQNKPYLQKSESWLLGLHDETWVEEANGDGDTSNDKMRTLLCFDTVTGFLTGRRTLRDATNDEGDFDVLTLFKVDTYGNVEEESTFGGDVQDVSAIDHCTYQATGAQYRLTHSYSFGSLSQTIVKKADGGDLLKPVLRSIDPSTGLARTVTDPAGVVTTYDYDTSGRLKSVTSDGSATTSYQYNNFDASGPAYANVVVTVDSADADNDTEQTVEFDSFGRVVEETRDVLAAGGSSTASRKTEYDKDGRKKRLSMWETTPTHYTEFEYDALGRTTKVTAPDAKTGTFHYDGDRSVTRTALLGTVYNAGTNTTTESRVAVTELRDVHGRLVEVQEGRPVTTAADGTMTFGTAEVKTAYKYDVGGRLTDVAITGKDMDGVQRTQDRSFEYDVVGFLTEETHPESGTTAYRDIDAKGHAKYVDQGDAHDDMFDLELEFDEAERQTKVLSWVGPGDDTYQPVKEFVYDESNAHGKSAGKLAVSKRHNYTSFGDVLVTETFFYNDTAGRLTDKTTKIENVTTNTVYKTLDQSVVYNDLGQQKTVNYPTCDANCAAANWSSVTNTYKKGYLKSIAGFVDDITYHPSGLYDTITHAGTVQVKDIQEADPHGLPRPQRIYTSGGVTCQTPTITTQPASETIPRGSNKRLQVTAANVVTYQWYQGPLGNRDLKVGGNEPFLDVVNLQVKTTFWVELTNQCGSVQSAAAVLDVLVCGSSTFSLTVSPANVADNTPFTLTAPSIVNTTYRWYRGSYASPTLLATTDIPSHTINTGVTTATQYFVEMEDPVCNQTAVKSQVLTVTPCAKPLAREIQSAANGSAVTLSVDDLGDGATFQWYQGSSYEDLSKPVGSTRSITVTPSVATSYWVRMTRTCGTVTTTADTPIITVNVACATSIFEQPLPATKAMPAPGGSVSVSTTVVPGGTGPFTYQWYRMEVGGAQPIAGATSATYTWNYGIQPGGTVPLAVQQVVYVMVQACGVQVESNHVMLSVVKTPQKIYAFDTRETLYGSYSAKLFVHMDPQPGPQHIYDYEWYQADGTATGRRLSASGPEVTVGPGAYWVKVTGQHNTEPDAQGNIFSYWEETVSKHAYVMDYGTCELPPLQISQSVSSIVSGTPNVTFLAYCDWADVTFQWYEGQTGDTREPVDGDDGKPHQLTVGSTTVRSYWVRASLECGAFHDSPTLIFTRGGCGPVLINQNIASTDVAYNAAATLRVDPINVARPSYTWYRGEGEGHVAGTGTTLTLPNVTESGRYWVKVRDLDCSNSSDSYIATVRVATCPSITPPIWETEVWTDKGVGKQLSAQSGGASGYQWYQGEVGDTSNMIGGATLATYTTPGLTQDTKYWVRVFGSSCIVDSPTMTVKVCDPPHLTSELYLNHNVVPGQWAFLGIQAAGTGITYQWYQGLSGDTSNPFGRHNDRIYVNTSQTNNYWVRMTAHCGPNGTSLRHLDSPTYTVSVCPAVQPPTTPFPKVMPGTTTTVSIAATGTALTYQWYVRTGSGQATAIPGATSATITTPPITGPTTFSCMVRSGNCPVQSEEITIELCDRPLINWTIGDKYIKKGEQVFFYVNAVGTEEESPLITFYAGDTGNTSTIVHGPSPYNFSRIVNETTKFWARATMGNCYADTPNITVTVCIPQITTQPAGGNITTGQSKTLTVATDIPATGYQWYIGEPGETGQPIAGATTASVTVSPTADTKYWVRAFGCGSSRADSAVALVTVCIPPGIRTHPYPSQWKQPGETTQLHVDATGTNVTYTWYRGATGDTTSPFSTLPSIFVNPAQTTSYWVRVSNGCGTADSNAAVINVCAIPEITQQPLSQNVFSGKSATLTVVATQATPTPMTYQWFSGTSVVNSTAIAGATSASYTTPALTAEANYWVRILAGGCSIDSEVATVSMCYYPEVLNAPDDRDIAAGGTTRLSVVMSPPPQSVVWYRGAQGDRSAAISSQAAVDVYPTATTQYWAELTHDGCTTKTRTVTVFVSIPTITTHPASVQVNNGQTATLSVVANTSGLTYQWYLGTSGGGTAIAGATGPSYTTPAMTTAASYWVKVTGSRGHAVNSNTATVTVCAPAAITQQPPSLSIQKGSSVNLAVYATGTNLRYQWYYGTSGNTASPAPGTSSTFNVSPNVPTSYWVKVTSDCGVVNSATATITVCAIPAISQQPLSQPIFSGKTATLTVAATQETGIPISYQWYRGTTLADSTAISGATSSSYTTPALTAETSYWVRLTSGACQIDSDVATVSMCFYPEILNAPDDRDVAVGGTTRLSVVLSPIPQSTTWYRGAQGDRSVAISSQSAVDVYPATTTQYWAEFTHDGCTTKTRTVTVFVSIPTITTQPASVQVNNGQTATLSVVANTSGLTYQWYLGTSGSGTAIAGATGPSYTTPPMTAAASYWVKVTGSRGHAVNSNTATVTVCAPAAITQQPPSLSIQKGSSVNLAVYATGTNLRYQWYYGTSGNTASPAPGTSSTFNISPNVPTSYWVKVTSDCGVVNSATATITVCAIPAISQQPLSQAIFSGRTATLSVTATQETGIPISYQWYRGTTVANSTAISGATAASYTTPALTTDTSYWVRLTSGACQIDSDVATVSMCFYPEITNAPDDRDIAAGGTTRLSVVLSPVPESGTWYRGAQGDRSAAISSQAAVDVYPTATTQYWAEFTHGGCTTKTRTVTVFVSIPTITTHPASVQVNNGQTTTLSVVANTSGLTYQWYLGTSGSGTAIAGATAASYTTPAMTAAASYWVKVTGSRGHAVNSNTATVTVCSPAVITQQPVSRSIQKGNNTTITVAATGTNRRYQWYYGTSGNTASPAPSTNDYITVSPNVPTSYWVKVTSDCGSVNSNTATVTVCATPVITQQPRSQPIFSGKTATLSVTATQETGIPISYQWYQGTSGTGTAIAGATSSTYTTPALTAETNYWVRITSGVCQTDSNTATVSMCFYPEVFNGPDDRDIAAGQTVRLSLTMSPPPESGRWYRGVQGDRSVQVSSWSFADVAPTVTTQYWGELTYGGCTAKTRTVTVYVSIPTITTQPANTMVNGGTSATLSVVANTAGLTYQWYSGTSGGGTPISGATGASYVTPALGAGSTANYWVKVTGSRGHAVNSNTATVTWCNPATITQQPISRSIRRGYSTTITVTGTGTNLRYQWYYGVSGNTASPAPSQSSYITVSPSNPQQYWVRLTSDCGVANSVTVNVDVCVDPTIDVQPASHNVPSGTSATLSVSATSGTTLGLSYQWYSGTSGMGSPIAGATSSTYTTPPLTGPADYWVLVRSGDCYAYSDTASIGMCFYPAVVGGPSDRNVAYQQQTYINMVLSPQPDQITWYEGPVGTRTTPISGATAFYLYPSVTKQYWAELVFEGCVSRTNAFTVNVCVPTITANPVSKSIPRYTSTTLSVTAREATSYQWYIGSSPGTGTPITGATSATYTTPALSTATSYWVRVTGACTPTKNSTVATVSVY